MKRQRLLLVVAVVFSITALAACTKTSKPEIKIPEFDFLSASYTIENNVIKLENGKSEIEITSGSATKTMTSAWGKPVYGDLNGDRVDDSALILVQDPGGSGTFYYVGAALIDSNNKYIETNTLLLGDRILLEDIEIKEGVITVKYKDRKSDQPMTETRSIDASKKFEVENGMLNEITNQNKSNEEEYSVAKTVAKDNNNVFYPQISGLKGELLMDYVNQSLKKVADKYSGNINYMNVMIDYSVTKQDDKVLSVLYKGTADMKDVGNINIMESVNLDIGMSTNEILYNNIFKNSNVAKLEVKKILDEAAKLKGIQGGIQEEGVRVYYSGDNIVFFFMPLDDSAKEFLEISIPKSKIEQYMNTDFGEKPAS